MIYLLAFVVVVLAVARATRVIVIDEIAAPLRNWIFGRYGQDSKPGKIVSCYWCAGFWVALFVSAYTHLVACVAGWLPWHTVALLPVIIFAVAYGASWVLDKEGIADGA